MIVAVALSLVPLGDGAIAVELKFAHSVSARARLSVSTVPALDCNANGILDHRDASLGTIEDLNGNGSEDRCERDPKVLSFLEDGWKQWSQRSDTSYVGLRYRRGEKIVIRYTVPRGRHLVRITASDRARGTTLGLRNSRQREGAYEFPWQPKGKDGELMPDGQFDLRITIASRAYDKVAAWHWTREPAVTGEGRPSNP